MQKKGKKIYDYVQHPSKIILYLMNKGVMFFLNDETYLKIKYYLITKKRLDLKKPQTFNQKLQWLKLYDRNPEYIKMVDKYEVKEYVSKIIGEEYIIPTLGIYDNFNEIDFDRLPNQFVMKCTHDSGGNIICKDKQKLDYKYAKEKIEKCLKQNYYKIGKEWPYKNVRPRIIVEKYMATEEQIELIDYKFFCFNGEPEFIYVSQGLSNHKTARISFADMDYQKMNFYRKDYKEFKKLPPKPRNFEKMKELARKLSQNIPFIRVDFYEIRNKVFFSELTFFPCSGYIPFEPEKYDTILGDMLSLPKEKREEK